MSVAISNGDNKGRNNYAAVLLHCLKIQLHSVNEKLSCQQINALSVKPNPKPPKANANSVNSPDGSSDPVAKGRGAKAKSKCTVCQQGHHTLFSCPQLTSFIPEGTFKQLPQSVCKGCLRSDGKTDKCHKPKSWFVCQKSKYNIILCKCPEHANHRDWFKKHFNHVQHFSNVKICNQTLGIVRNNQTIASPVVKTGFMSMNWCRIGHSSCSV